MTISQRARAAALESVPEVLAVGDRTLTATYRVGDAEPVLEGHFPGFPILPGVCLIECAQWTARQALLATGCAPRPAAVESVRFLRPVYPGDELRVHVSVDEPREGVWVCTARLAVAAASDPDAEPAQAALVRLRFHAEGESR